jgi:hypothetical protein
MEHASISKVWTMRNFVIVAAGLPSSNGFVYDSKIA